MAMLYIKSMIFVSSHLISAHSPFSGTAHDGTDGDDAWMGAEGDDDNDGDNDNDMNEEGRGDYLAALQRHKDEARRARGEAAEGEEEAHPDEASGVGGYVTKCGFGYRYCD